MCNSCKQREKGSVEKRGRNTKGERNEKENVEKCATEREENWIGNETITKLAISSFALNAMLDDSGIADSGSSSPTTVHA